MRRRRDGGGVMEEWKVGGQEGRKATEVKGQIFSEKHLLWRQKSSFMVRETNKPKNQICF